MTIYEMRTHIEDTAPFLRAKYNLEWISAVINYQSGKKGFVACDIHIIDGNGIGHGKVFLAENSDSGILTQAIELVIKSIIARVKV